jgi:hypothetical protein
VQAELSAVRILSELLRFLLMGFTLCAPVPSVFKAVEFPTPVHRPSLLTQPTISDYNVQGFHS